MENNDGTLNCQRCSYISDVGTSSCAMCGAVLENVVPSDVLGAAAGDCFGTPTASLHSETAASLLEKDTSSTKPSAVTNQQDSCFDPAESLSTTDATTLARIMSGEWDGVEEELIKNFLKVLSNTQGDAALVAVSIDHLRDDATTHGIYFQHDAAKSKMIAHEDSVAIARRDEALAAQLQKAAFDNNYSAYGEILYGEDVLNDAVIAEHLQDHCNAAPSVADKDAILSHKKEEEYEMLATSSGRAWILVEKVIHLAQSHGIECLAIDEMVVLAETFIEKQMEFEFVGRPPIVTIGYHNTKPEHLPSIQQQGLISSSGGRRLYFGDGLYTANNPEAFRNYGCRGLMCAILQGETGRISRGGIDRDDLDTGIGNKEKPGVLSIEPLYKDEYVLKTAAQCLPLFSYDASSGMIAPQKLWECQVKLQKLLDNFFNDGIETVCHRIEKNDPVLAVANPVVPAAVVLPWTPPRYNPSSRREVTAPLVTLSYLAPDSILGHGYEMISTYEPCSEMDFAMSKHKGCSICLGGFVFRENMVKLIKCNHVFHRVCIDDALQHSVQCPICRQALTDIQGKSPSGKMAITWSSFPCDGYEHTSAGSFMITYTLPAGVQKQYHDQPGLPYSPTTRKTFVPYTEEGWGLLKRLVWAFQHGLTFTVGTSLTSGLRNAITWSSIHHKTKRSGGQHGFPDPNYFLNSDAELNALCVPPASDLPDYIKMLE